MDETAALSLQSDAPLELARQTTAEGRKDGGQAEFERVVAEHQERIGRLVHRLLEGSDGVEDVVQDVFLAALAGLGRFRDEARLSTWLTAIAVNRCRSRRRRRGLWRRWLPWVARSEVVRERHATEGQIGEEVRRAVGRLPDKYREPIVLRYFEEMPISQIAEVLRLVPNTVEARLSRARRRLKEMLADRLEEP